jgi:hypothetical protein
MHLPQEVNSRGLWATPTDQDSSNDGGPSQYERHSVPLNAQVKLWATPRKEGFDAGKHRGVADSLHSQVKMWPTMASTSSGGTHGLGGGSGNTRKLREMVGEEVGKQMACGSLNPAWVEALMGYPVGWTDITEED